MTKKLNSNSMKLLVSNSLFRASKLVFGIFLNIYLWKETNDIQLLALFNITFLLSHGLGFIGLSYLVKLGHRRIINFLSFMGLISSYLFIIFLGELVIDYIFLVGFIFGLFNGTYYIGYNVNQFDLTTFKNRGNFEGIKKALKIGTKMIFPAFFGLIIGFYSIEMALWFGIGLFILGYIVGDVKFKYNTGKLSLFKFIKIIFENKKIMYSILGSFFFTLALSLPLLDLIIPLLIYDNIGSEIKLGFSLSLLSFFSIIIIYLFGRFIDYKYYNKSLIILSIVYIFSLLGIIYSTSLPFILFFSSIIVSVIALYGVGVSVMTNNSLHSVKNYNEYKVEFNIFKEGSYILGWIIGFIIMYFSGELSQKGLGILFYSMMIFSIFSTFFLMKVNIHEIKD